MLFQQTRQPVLPAFGGRVGLPRVNAEGGQDEIRMIEVQFFDRSPIRFAGRVDDTADDSRLPHRPDHVFRIAEPGILKVIVGVDPGSHGLPGSAEVGSILDLDDERDFDGDVQRKRGDAEGDA